VLNYREREHFEIVSYLYIATVSVPSVAAMKGEFSHYLDAQYLRKHNVAIETP
jgi:hypothetical protein